MRREALVTLVAVMLACATFSADAALVEIARFNAGGGAFAGHFSPDGHRFAIACQDGTVKLYDADTWDLVWEKTLVENGMVLWVRFSPDGRSLVATITGQPDVIFLKPQTGAEVNRFTLPKKCPNGKVFDAVHAFAISPDEAVLACGAFGNVCVSTVDAGTGDVLGTPIAHPSGEHPGLEFSPDGRFLASTSGNSVMVWDIEADEVRTLRTTGISNPQVVAFSPDGSILAVGGANATAALLFDTSTWEVTRLTASSRGFKAGAVGFSPDGRFFATGFRELKLWDGSTLELLSSNAIHDRAASWLQFSPDGEQLVVVEVHVRVHWASSEVTVWRVADLIGE